MRSDDYIQGFKAAVESLGREGDHRRVDWSAPFEYLNGEAAMLSKKFVVRHAGIIIKNFFDSREEAEKWAAWNYSEKAVWTVEEFTG